MLCSNKDMIAVPEHLQQPAFELFPVPWLSSQLLPSLAFPFWPNRGAAAVSFAGGLAQAVPVFGHKSTHGSHE